MIKVLGFSARISAIEQLNEQDLKLMADGKSNEKIQEIQKVIEFFDSKFKENKFYLGISTTKVSLTFIFKEEIGKKEVLKLMKQIQEQGYECIFNGKGVVDERYLLDNKFKSFTVDLPPVYVDDAICEFFDRNGLEYKIEQSLEKNCVIYTTDLGFFKLMFITNSIFIGGGMEQHKAHTTINVARDYKKVIKGVEKDYLDWRKNHPNKVS